MQKTLERTFERFGDEVCSRLGLLYMVTLHNLTLFVETQVPATARLLLPIDHWRVGHVIVLKHRLFEFALWCEVLLWELNGQRRQQRHKRQREWGEEQYSYMFVVEYLHKREKKCVCELVGTRKINKARVDKCELKMVQTRLVDITHHLIMICL